MARLVHIKIITKLDSRATPVTVTIDRDRGTFSVRPKHRRRTYNWPLDRIAAMVYQRVVQAEILKKREEKAKERKLRREARGGR